MNDIVLKPCPFCGAEARMWTWNGGTRIDCSKWGSSDDNTHFVGVGAKTKEKAVELWNERMEE